MQPNTRVLAMPDFMRHIDEAGIGPPASRRPLGESSTRRIDARPRPWRNKGSHALQDEMKAMCADFQRSGISTEQLGRTRGVRGVRSGRPASAAPSVDWEGEAPRAAPDTLGRNDHRLAQDVFISDQEATLTKLKRRAAAEQQRFKRELCEAQQKAEELNARELELRSQNQFLFEAIDSGHMGEAFDLQSFRACFGEIAAVDEWLSLQDDDGGSEADDRSLIDDDQADDRLENLFNDFCRAGAGLGGMFARGKSMDFGEFIKLLQHLGVLSPVRGKRGLLEKAKAKEVFERANNAGVSRDSDAKECDFAEFMVALDLVAQTLGLKHRNMLLFLDVDLAAIGTLMVKVPADMQRSASTAKDSKVSLQGYSYDQNQERLSCSPLTGFMRQSIDSLQTLQGVGNVTENLCGIKKPSRFGRTFSETVDDFVTASDNLATTKPNDIPSYAHDVSQPQCSASDTEYTSPELSPSDLTPAQSPPSAKEAKALAKQATSVDMYEQNESSGHGPVPDSSRAFRSRSEKVVGGISPTESSIQDGHAKTMLQMTDVEEKSRDYISSNTTGDDHDKDLIFSYMKRLLRIDNASPGALPSHPITGSEDEFLKRQPLVLEQVNRILGGADDFKDFIDAINKCGAKGRVDMLNVVAQQFKRIGMLSRAMHCLVGISSSPLDPAASWSHFVSEVHLLLGASKVRLWLVDEQRSLIWEWDPSGHEREKRPFVMTTIGEGESPSAERLALHAMAMSHDDDDLNGDSKVLCEPVRHKGAIVAVVQCFLHEINTDKDGTDLAEKTAFTETDDLMLRFMCQSSGFLFHRTHVFIDSMSSLMRTMRLFVLTSHYPLTSGDMYTLSVMQLKHTQATLGASLCVLYLASGHGIMHGRMWTKRADGLDTHVEISFGEGIAGWVARELSPVVSNDAENDPRFDSCADLAFAAGASKHARNFRVASILSIPMKRHDGTLFGVCSMIKDNKNSSPFTHADHHLLELHCELVVTSFRDVTPEGSEFKPYETIADALNRCKMLLNVEWALFFQLSDDKTKLILQKPVRLSVPLADPLLGYVVRTGVSVSIPDATMDPRLNADLARSLGSKITALMCSQVQDGNDRSLVLGLLFIANKRHAHSGNDAFGEEDIKVGEMVARQIGQMLALDPTQDVAKTLPRNQTSMQDMER